MCVLFVSIRYRVYHCQQTVELCIVATCFILKVNHLQVNKKYVDDCHQIIAVFYFMRIIILPALLYGFETWSFTFRERV
jgi:hypothetical protein